MRPPCHLGVCSLEVVLHVGLSRRVALRHPASAACRQSRGDPCGRCSPSYRRSMPDTPSSSRGTWRYHFTRPGGDEVETGELTGDEAATARARRNHKGRPARLHPPLTRTPANRLANAIVPAQMRPARGAGQLRELGEGRAQQGLPQITGHASDLLGGHSDPNDGCPPATIEGGQITAGKDQPSDRGRMA